jgi:hypothetical protein
VPDLSPLGARPGAHTWHHLSHGDRLARSTFDRFAIVKRIGDAKAQFRSLAEPWADTGAPAPGV